MAAFLSVRTSTIILAVIAAVYSVISVLLLACICCLCYKKRKLVRAITPKSDYVSPHASDAEIDPGSNPGSPVRKDPTDVSSAAAQGNQIPSRYRRKKAMQVETCPEWEGDRDSPVLRQRDAWSGEKNLEDFPSHPRTPDSGLPLSLGDSKNSETLSGRGLTDSPNSSIKGSRSNGSSDDVFDDNVTQLSSDLSKSFEEKKREVRRRAPRPIRTESTTPLMDDDEENDLVSPSSEMEFNIKPALPPIREKARSSDSLDGTIFVNKSAVDYVESERTTYTELSTLNTDPSKQFLPTASGGRETLPPIHHGLGGLGPAERDLELLSRVGRLPPLYPPGHSQENLNDLEEHSTVL